MASLMSLCSAVLLMTITSDVSAAFLSNTQYSIPARHDSGAAILCTWEQVKLTHMVV